jgi:hypothetical protein
MARRTGDARALLAVAALFAAAPAAAADEVRVEASTDREALALDETLTLTIRIEAEDAPASVDLGEAELPFTVVSRQESRTSSFAFGSGGFRRGRTTVLRVTLAPKRAGDLVIPPVVAVVKGARHETEPIRVKVLAAGARPPTAAPPERRGGAWRGWERDLVLEVELDRREVFLGEQLTATVWLLSPVGVVAYEQFRPPAYDGFWVEELETPRRLAHRLRTVNGVPTRAYLLQRIALFPTRAGEAELGPYQLDVAVRVGSDSLLSPFQDVRRVRRRSAPVAIRVKPLPAGAPPGFDGVNVGAWRIEATTSSARVAAGEPVAVRVKVSGDGNVRALAPPRLPELPGARRFEPTLADEVAAKAGRLAGSRTLETVLVPAAAGILAIPPLEWPFFDPRSGRYEVARTRALRVEVLPGAPPAAAPAAAGAAALAAALHPLRPEGALAPRAAPPWRRAPFLALVAVPPLLFAALVLRDGWRRRATEGAPARRARGAGRLAGRRLRAAGRRLAAGQRAAALDEIEGALAGFAADRLGRPVAGMTRDDLGAALAAAGFPPAGISELAAALEACDAGRFGGGAAPEDVLARAERALALLEAPRDAGGGAP